MKNLFSKNSYVIFIIAFVFSIICYLLPTTDFSVFFAYECALLAWMSGVYLSNLKEATDKMEFYSKKHMLSLSRTVKTLGTCLWVTLIAIIIVFASSKFIDIGADITHLYYKIVIYTIVFCNLFYYIYLIINIIGAVKESTFMENAKESDVKEIRGIVRKAFNTAFIHMAYLGMLLFQLLLVI